MRFKKKYFVSQKYFLLHKNISCSTLTLPAYSLRYVPRREREDQERDSIPMNNGMSNTNFKGDTEF